MAKFQGLGGYWVVAGTPNLTVHNAEYEVDTESENDDVTDSTSSGWRQGISAIKKFTARMSVAEDDVAYPQALGFTEGTTLSVWFKRGSLIQFDQVVGTLVRRVRVTNDQTKARRVEIELEFGAFARNVGAPA